ncbi:MAG: hypothetical protein J6O49_13355 [Bacteroidaceae bacterium]|nr:hypothetical protein [Bacteroidaceae bacterium]
MKKTYVTPETTTLMLHKCTLLAGSATVDGDSKLYDKNNSDDASKGLSRSFFFDEEEEF